MNQLLIREKKMLHDTAHALFVKPYNLNNRITTAMKYTGRTRIDILELLQDRSNMIIDGYLSLDEFFATLA